MASSTGCCGQSMNEFEKLRSKVGYIESMN